MILKGASSAMVFAACVALTACGAQDRDPAPVDTAAGVIDSAPASVATGVAAVLTDENVLALLDTAYAAMLEVEQLAQEKATNPQVKQFARRSVTQHALARRQTAVFADRLNIAPVLPERDVLAEHRKAIEELRTATGEAFDRAFLERAIETRKTLLGDVDEALEGTRQEAMETFLRQMRSTIDADLKTAQQLASKIG